MFKWCVGHINIYEYFFSFYLSLLPYEVNNASCRSALLPLSVCDPGDFKEVPEGKESLVQWSWPALGFCHSFCLSMPQGLLLPSWGSNSILAAPLSLEVSSDLLREGGPGMHGTSSLPTSCTVVIAVLPQGGWAFDVCSSPYKQ
jgi:hypothetical protein